MGIFARNESLRLFPLERRTGPGQEKAFLCPARDGDSAGATCLGQFCLPWWIMPLQISDWNIHFENNKSRERKQCAFVCVPNKQHGMGFCRIMAEPDGAAIYGIWICILCACSQQKDRDGWLTVDGHQAGTAWAPDDLAIKFRRPLKEVDRALQVLMSEKVGWIKSVAIDVSARPVPAQCPLSALEEKRREEKRREENRIEEKRRERREGKKAQPPAALSGFEFPENLRAPQFESAWTEWTNHLLEKKCKTTPSAFGKQIKFCDEIGLDRAVIAINHSIKNNWQGIYEPKPQNNGAHKAAPITPDHTKGF